MVIKDGSCFIKYKQPLESINSVLGKLYAVSDVKVSFKDFSDNLLKIRYVIKYSFHKENKTEDVGVIELDYTNYSNSNKMVLAQFIPYIPYPSDNPLYEIKADYKNNTNITGPHKGLDIITMNLLNIETDKTSISSSSDWPVFRVIPTANITNAYKLMVEGKPIFNDWFNRFKIFFYYSGITFMTVGYGDITPITTATRTWAIIESFFGVVLIGLFSASFFGYIVNLFSRPWKELEKYLGDKDNWTKSTDPQAGIDMLYYIPNPDFKIMEGVSTSNFDVPWTKIYPNSQGQATDFWVKYKDTVLYNFRFIYCDGGAGLTILPDKRVKYYDGQMALPSKSYFFLDINDLKYKLNKLVQDKYGSTLTFQFNEFKSIEGAEKEIEESFKAPSDHLTCFELQSAGSSYTLINRK
ncbi:potassium channel family protein [Bacteriovoracaceae bacterium]|nr:potassium channel family protein [Bacteriovoracaceae bacterium]